MDPLIRAVMITGKPGREYLARMAITSFLEQKYPRKQLLIVNDGEPLLKDPVEDVIEHRIPGGLTLGALRNLALDLSPPEVDYLVQWDDDDYSHPQRLRWQIDATPTGAASVLRYTTNICLGRKAPRICTPTRVPGYGFAGTIMHPAKTAFRYPEEAKGEDSKFSRQWRNAGRMHVLHNVQMPALYLRFFHGNNTWSERHILGFPRAPISLSPTERTRVLKLANTYANASAKSCSRGPGES